MVAWEFLTLALVTAVIVAVAVYFFVIILRRSRRVGNTGIIQRSHLKCPKCHREFDYDWIPGASLTAVRLGTQRYMACPLCRKWSLFDIYTTMVARTPSAPTPTDPLGPPPR
jgi:hypothetical protein